MECIFIHKKRFRIGSFRLPSEGGKVGERLSGLLWAEHDRWFLWIPVLFGAGIASALTASCPPSEVGVAVLGMTASASAVLVLFRCSGLCSVLCGHGLLWFCSGFLWGTGFTEFRHRTPLLTDTTPVICVEGRVRCFSPRVQGFRLVLDHLEMREARPFMPFTPAPEHSVTLAVRQKPDAWCSGPVHEGAQVRVWCVLNPWSGPVTPGGFHAARHAAWSGSVATGYTVAWPSVISASESGFLVRLRHTLNQSMSQNLSKDAAPLAQALVTGEKGLLAETTRQAFACSGLAHLLAISGLHMSLVMGIVFSLARRLVGLNPGWACSVDARRMAVVPAVLAGAFYLVLSGSAVPARRAWIMGALVAGGVLVNRKALSLRTLALAAMAIMMIHPPAVMSASFQLSFAAVLGLAGRENHPGHHPWPVSLVPVFLRSSIHASVVATLATLPLVLAHFGQCAPWSVVANLLGVPWTCMVVVPLGMLTLVLGAGGLDGAWVWHLWDASLVCLHTWAVHVSTWPGSDMLFPAPPRGALPCILVGGIWTVLWRTSWRLWGWSSILAGAVWWILAPRPSVLFSPGCQTWAVVRDGELWMSSLRSRRLQKEWKHLAGAHRVRRMPRGSTPDPLAHQASQKGGGVILEGRTRTVLTTSAPEGSGRYWDARPRYRVRRCA